MPLLHVSHWPRSHGQCLQTTLYMMSARPPLSSGGPHSSVTEVPFTLEIRFTGVEGGPGKKAEIQADGKGKGLWEVAWSKAPQPRGGVLCNGEQRPAGRPEEDVPCASVGGYHCGDAGWPEGDML